MAIIHLTTADFDEAIKSEKPILVDFWAPWCGPCRMLAPVLEEVNATLGDNDVTIGKVNIDDEPVLASKYGVLSIPTMIVFRKRRSHFKTRRPSRRFRYYPAARKVKSAHRQNTSDETLGFSRPVCPFELGHTGRNFSCV